MASYTPNLNLYKPDGTDDYGDFLTKFNSNMDKLDQGGGNQNIAEDYDDTATYAVGDYVIYNGLLYKCDTAVTMAETFDPTKWTHVVVTDEMGSGGGGSGDTVTWNQIQQSGTKIAEISINGTSQDVYAPQGGGSGGHTIYDPSGNALAQESGLQFTGAVSVSDDSVNGRTVVDIEGGGNYYLNTIYSTEEKKIGYWTDGKPLYQKTYEFSTVIPVSANTYTTIVSSAGLNIDTLVYGETSPSKEATFTPISVNVTANGDIQCYYITAWSIKYLTIRYTKTTDTADPNPQVGNVIYLPTIYSEEERQVGVWRDNKPLYQKTLVINNLNLNTSGTVVDITSLGVDMCCPVYEGSYYIVSGVERGFARLEYQQPNEVYLYPAVNRTGTTSFITLQYTKTTDTAGSGEWTPSGELAHHYSTNEQVIGTWIDGKPLYEKTWDNLSIALNANNWVYFNDPVDIENVISFVAYYYNSDRYLHCAISEYQRSNSNGIMFSGFSGFNRTVNRIVAQYTKTTD